MHGIALHHSIEYKVGPSTPATPDTSKQMTDRELLLRAVQKIETLESEVTVLRGARGIEGDPNSKSSMSTVPSTPARSARGEGDDEERPGRKAGELEDDTIVTPDGKPVTCLIFLSIAT